MLPQGRARLKGGDRWRREALKARSALAVRMTAETPRRRSVRVRWAGSKDGAALKPLFHGGMREEGLAPRPGAWERTLKASRGKEAPFRFVVAEAGPHVVGCMSLHRFFSTYNGLPSMSVEDVFVDPRHRGHGIGAAMLGFAEDAALDLGAVRLELHVRRGNPAARLYRRLGFELVDYDWMQKRLLAEAVTERKRARRDSNPRSPA